MTARARRYAHALFIRRPWVPRSFAMQFEFAERGWHPLDRNVAWRVGKKLAWDAPNMKAAGCPEADALLRRDYRQGWSL